jgi:hypothetical protein
MSDVFTLEPESHEQDPSSIIMVKRSRCSSSSSKGRSLSAKTPSSQPIFPGFGKEGARTVRLFTLGTVSDPSNFGKKPGA